MKRKGFSLFELVVALGLGLLILQVLSSVVWPLTKAALQGFGEVALAQTALTLEAGWGRDLTRSRPEDRQLAGPARWLLRPLADRLVDGKAVWTDDLVVYELVAGQLRRRQVTMRDSAVAIPEAGTLASLLASSASSRLVAPGVESLQCQVGEGGAVTVTAVLTHAGPGGAVRSRWQRTWVGRNR